MKKILLTFVLFASFAYISKLNAQCSIAQSSVIVNIHSVTADLSGGCTTLFDLTFDLAGNGGNKWSHVHFWDANAYPAIVYSSGTGPNFSTLNGGVGSPTPVLATVSMDYHLGTNVVSSSYPPDNTVPVETAGVTYTRTAVTGATRFTITNISVHSNNCNPLNLKADVWSAQDNNGKNVGCSVSNLAVQADEPQVTGLIFCNNPRTYTISIKTKVVRDVTWTAYRDVAPFGVFDGADQANIVDGPRTQLANPGDNAFHTYGPFTYTGGNVIGNTFSIWLVATATGVNNSNIAYVGNSCFPLPVGLRSFVAARSHSSVSLTWVTSSEQNNSGFQVQRQIGTGSWQTLGFVASQAQDGNSSTDLTYTYSDQNNTKGMSNYRIMQIDRDGKFTYSPVRAVRGEGLLSKITIYPNPTSDGKVNVVFDDASTVRDISLMDINGRVVKQWKGETNNNLVIDNLTAGFYNLKIVVRETGEQSVEKIVVNKR